MLEHFSRDVGIKFSHDVEINFSISSEPYKYICWAIFCRYNKDDNDKLFATTFAVPQIENYLITRLVMIDIFHTNAKFFVMKLLIQYIRSNFTKKSFCEAKFCHRNIDVMMSCISNKILFVIRCHLSTRKLWRSTRHCYSKNN